MIEINDHKHGYKGTTSKAEILCHFYETTVMYINLFIVLPGFANFRTLPNEEFEGGSRDLLGELPVELERFEDETYMEKLMDVSSTCTVKENKVCITLLI